MVKCDYCGKGRPKLWSALGKFCDEECQRKYSEGPMKKKVMLRQHAESERCPICDATLVPGVGHDSEYGAFDGYRCPNGCNLAAKFGGGK